MKYYKKSGKLKRVIVSRIKLGSDLLLSLKEIAEEEDIKAGIILSGLGALRKATIRNIKTFPKEFPVTDKNRLFKTIEKPIEVLSLSGNISEKEGEPLIHAHLTISFIEEADATIQGGHLVEGCIVYPFAEIILGELEDIKMVKVMDYETNTYQLFSD